MPTTTETRMTKEYGIILPESLNVGGGGGGLVEYATPTDYMSVAKERDIIIAPIKFSVTLGGSALKYTEVSGIRIITGEPKVTEEIVASSTHYMIAIVGRKANTYFNLSPIANTSVATKGVAVSNANSGSSINIGLTELGIESMEMLKNGIITVRRTGIFSLTNFTSGNTVMGSRQTSNTYSYEGKIYVIPA